MDRRPETESAGLPGGQGILAFRGGLERPVLTHLLNIRFSLGQGGETGRETKLQKARHKRAGMRHMFPETLRKVMATLADAQKRGFFDKALDAMGAYE